MSNKQIWREIAVASILQNLMNLAVAVIIAEVATIAMV